jgi:CubicO group peptidase (beta-lactamase class C family)
MISGLPAAWSKVTVRHCLSHTTGLPYATEDEINGTVLEGDRDKLIERLSGRDRFPTAAAPQAGASRFRAAV